jgi:hypothetical protein
MTSMHKGYAYQFFDCIAYKRKLNKEQRISTPRTTPKFVGNWIVITYIQIMYSFEDL